MFRFFQALASLVANTQALADSMAEANQRLRENLALDAPPAEVPALEHEDRTVRRNGRKVAESK